MLGGNASGNTSGVSHTSGRRGPPPPASSSAANRRRLRPRQRPRTVSQHLSPSSARSPLFGSGSGTPRNRKISTEVLDTLERFSRRTISVSSQALSTDIQNEVNEALLGSGGDVPPDDDEEDDVFDEEVEERQDGERDSDFSIS